VQFCGVALLVVVLDNLVETTNAFSTVRRPVTKVRIIAMVGKSAFENEDDDEGRERLASPIVTSAGLDSEKAERTELRVLWVLLGGNRIRPPASGSDLAESRNPIKR
jgi:hypothetical protein